MEALLAALLGGFLLFNAAATPGKAAKVMEAALRKSYPNATVAAQVEGKRGRAVLKGNFRKVRLTLTNIGEIESLPFAPANDDAKCGHLGRFELALRDFRFSGLPVESAEIGFDELDYDLAALRQDGKLQILRSGPGQTRLTTTAAALEKLFAKNLRGITDVQVALKDGRVVVNAKKTVPILEVGLPFIFTARPEPRGNEIWLTDGRIAMENVTGITIPVKNLLGDLNPIFTFDPDRKWPYRVQLTKVESHANKMEITAELLFTGLKKS